MELNTKSFLLVGGLVASIIGVGGVLTYKEESSSGVLECYSKSESIMGTNFTDVRSTIYGFIPFFGTERTIRGYNVEGQENKVRLPISGDLLRFESVKTDIGTLKLIKESDCEYYLLETYKFPLKRPSDYVSQNN